MELDQSPIKEELALIQNSYNTNGNNFYSAVFTMGEMEYTPKWLMEIDIERDYEKNFGDNILAKFFIPFGDFIKQVYPNRDHLTISLYRKPLAEFGDGDQDDAQVSVGVFKGVLNIEGNENYEGTDYEKYTQEDLNLKRIIDVKFQLINRSVEKLMLVTMTRGNFRKTTNELVMRAILSSEARRIQVDGEPSVEAFNIVEVNNTEPREHIMFPPGLRLMDLPGYLQTNCGGVYSCGIGSYVQNKDWYIYPLTNTTRFENETKTLTVIKVDAARTTGTERTYRVDGDSVFIAATEKSRFIDSNETDFINQGNGVRFSDANKFMNDLSVTLDNVTVFKRGKNNSEFIVKETANKVNSVFTSNNTITSNSFHEYSKLNARNGGLFSFVWENGDQDLLFPGMMVRIIYMDSDSIKEYHGVLLYNHTYIQLEGGAITAKKHTNTTMLSVFASLVNRVDISNSGENDDYV